MMRWLALALVVISGCLKPTPPSEPPPQTVSVTAPEGEDAGTIPPYDRDEWGRWVDADKDCQDTRQEVLIAESEVSVTFTDPTKPCRVATGKWTDPYSGQVYTDPGDLHVDHVVALEEAHNAGGWAWTREQKRAYANDLDNPHHLQASSRSSNTSKGSRPPTEWMPPNEAYRCEYLRRRITILRKYKLKYDPDQYIDLLSANCK